MLIYYEYQPYLLTDGTSEEAAMIADIPRRKKFARRLRSWMFLPVAAYIVVVGTLGFMVDGRSLGLQVLVITGIASLFAAMAAMSLMMTYDYRRPFLRLLDAGRIVDLRFGVGQAFLDVLFTGKCELEQPDNRYAALELIDRKLVEAFWQDKRNREVLYRLSKHSTGETGVLARQVLAQALEAITDNLAPHAALLRKLELLAKENAAARKTKEELDAYDGLREYLRGADLLPHA